ncbi:quinol dehydrogenase ferredoxin subunit NapH [Prosthecomicrobium sp. N25]|uniref:quinol dehydrogenase ferredoxin subunit NapH n=1 Tax=Prosthecomicrobium sp. N25 TaxID=3129254 RepID=UPI0030773F19
MSDRSFFARHRWLLARRLSQAGVLGLFLAGPLLGISIAKGSLASSMTLGLLPLTDPLVLLQSIAAGHGPAATALAGAAIVAAFYALVSGRAYCAWVCPVNPVTDAAHWLRERLGIQSKGWQPRPATRLWMLAMVVAGSALSGMVLWELVNPVTMLFRGLVFGLGFAWTLVLAVFVLDLLVARRGWCSHLCPVGAAYGLLGARSLVRVSATDRAACDDCMDCFAVCPEPQVIVPALKGAGRGHGPVILDRDCTTCGRCIDVCNKSVFRFTHRFDDREGPAGAAPTREVTP